MSTLADRLKHARTERGLSQAELAKRARVSVGTIGNLEAGIRKTARNITQIAAVLGVRPEWLADGSGTQTVDTQSGSWPFGRLSPADWAALGPLQAVVEDVAVTKARELLSEISTRDAASRKQGRGRP